jgi:hypothetical protein
MTNLLSTRRVWIVINRIQLQPKHTLLTPIRERKLVIRVNLDPITLSIQRPVPLSIALFARKRLARITEALRNSIAERIPAVLVVARRGTSGSPRNGAIADLGENRAFCVVAALRVGESAAIVATHGLSDRPGPGWGECQWDVVSFFCQEYLLSSGCCPLSPKQSAARVV